VNKINIFEALAVNGDGGMVTWPQGAANGDGGMVTWPRRNGGRGLPALAQAARATCRLSATRRESFLTKIFTGGLF
jgi:hypothetical protein